MPYAPQIKVPATYLRGGTSKGVFFRLQDLPASVQQPGAARDKFLMRVIGSPDPYAAHIDGMGGATSSTSKCVIISKSSQPGHDVTANFRAPLAKVRQSGPIDGNGSHRLDRGRGGRASQCRRRRPRP